MTEKKKEKKTTRCAPPEVRDPPQDESGAKSPAGLHFPGIHLQIAAPPPQSAQSRGAAPLLHPRSLHHLHLNNKLKAVKFPHCDYQRNCIIELQTERVSCRMCYQKMPAADITTGARVCVRATMCQNARGCLGFKDFCEILGYNQRLGPVVPPLSLKIGQFEVISPGITFGKCLKIFLHQQRQW